MKNNVSLRKENYTALAEFMAVSFERDLAEFTSHFKTMDSDYLAKFKEAISEAKKVVSSTKSKLQQKETTKMLYEKAEELKNNLLFLKKYADNSGLETSMLSKIGNYLRNKNIEGAVISIREAMPYFMENKSKIMDMPEGFLDKIEPIVDTLESLNVQQNTLMNQSKQATNDGKSAYDNLYGYISQIADIGKLIYKNSHKKDEYTITKLLTRMNVADKKKEKGVEE